MAEGDTGAVRRGGEAQADSWTRREKAAEDMYIKQREKEIMQLLREKIVAQEKKLEIDREVLRTMVSFFLLLPKMTGDGGGGRSADVDAAGPVWACDGGEGLKRTGGRRCGVLRPFR